MLRRRSPHRPLAQISPLSRLIDATSGREVAGQVRRATGWWQSFKGLMLTPRLPNGHGLVIIPAKGIHTHFMRYPIDVVYFDETLRVTSVRAGMVPWRLDFTIAAGCVELPAGQASATGIQPGTQLRFEAAVTARDSTAGAIQASA